jgi:phosphatidylethanolamine-binding protein (PEBP) family uncharacterized protein
MSGPTSEVNRAAADGGAQGTVAVGGPAGGYLVGSSTLALPTVAPGGDTSERVHAGWGPVRRLRPPVAPTDPPPVLAALDPDDFAAVGAYLSDRAPKPSRRRPSPSAEGAPAHPRKVTPVALLGSLLRHRRPDERNYAWNQTNLIAPGTIEITSRDFTDGGTLAPRHTGTRVGGENLSPHLAWSEPPTGSAELLFLIEDIDAPLGAKPAVHCLAIIDEASLQTPHELPPGALGKKNSAPGVTLLRSTFGRGYLGPEPLKGHGPHRYVFQIYALGHSLPDRSDRGALLKSRPRALLASIDSPVLARGRITGVYER